MKSSPIPKQHGAVLAFSLVMLLLLTLVSTSMIQQNKVQITVATNAGQQVAAFATVETALLQAQRALEPLRYAAPVYSTDPLHPELGNSGENGMHHCRSDSQLHPIPHASATLTGLPTGVTAEIREVYCNSNYDPGRGAGDEWRCLYSGSGVRNTATGPIDNINACLRLNSAGTLGRGSAICNMETYMLNVTLTNPSTGARRTVESKFQINCSGDA